LNALFRAAWLLVPLLSGGCQRDDAEVVRTRDCVTESSATITDAASYARWLDATIAAEVVSYELARDHRPRLAAAAALLVSFAERNPRATQAELEAYGSAVDARLAAAYDGDPDLRRTAHVLPAIRFQSEDLDDPTLDGLDLRVGGRALEVLGLSPDPAARDTRATDLLRAADVDFAFHRPLTDLVRDSQLDRLPDGCGHAALSEAVQTLMSAHGVSLDPAELADRYPELAAARASAPDHATFLAEREQGFASLRVSIRDEMTAVRSRIDDNLADLGGALATSPVHVVEDPAPTSDPVRLEALDRQRREALLERARSRARLSLDAVLLAQSDEPADLDYAFQVETLGDLQLQAEDATEEAVLQLVEGGGGTILAVAKPDPVGALLGMMSVVDGIFDLVDDDPEVPTPEEQIFEQIQQLQRQIDAFRTEMHARFDSIDAQLDVLYRAMVSGLDEIDATTRRIERDVGKLRGELYALRSSLASLESNLYGVIVGGFHQDFVEDMETGLGHRRRTGTDLPYTGAGENTFFALHSRFYARATSAATSETYAGPVGRELVDDETAADALATFPLGYRINDLRELPVDLGLPPVFPSRVANPTTWSVAADAYAQLARENPWYFANLLDNDPTRLDELIAVGEEVEQTMRAMRDVRLFEALVERYRVRAEGLEALIGIDDYLLDRGMAQGLDPFGGLGQSPAGLGPELPEVRTPWSGDDTVPTWFDTSVVWERLFPELAIAYGSRFFEWETHEHEGRFELHYYGPGAVPPVTGDPPLPFVADQPWTVGLGLSDYEGQTTYLAGFAFDGAPPSDVDAWLRDHGEAIEGLVRAPGPGHVVEASDGRRLTLTDARLFLSTPRELPTYHPADLAAHLDDVAAQYGDHAVANLARTEPRPPPAALALARLESTRAILDAYVSLGLPETMATRRGLRGLLRGDSNLGGEGLYLDIIDAWDAQVRPPRVADTLNRYADRLLAHLRDAIAARPGGESHPYLAWSLASLRDLRDHAFDLCRPDRYEVRAGVPLVVPPAAGLLANDAEQPGLVSLRGERVEGPAHGTLTLLDDGSFTYEPDAGFSGQDRFAYRATARLDGDGGASSEVSSEPTEVILDVR